MRFQGLNLNLLAALQVLLDDCSVSVAARKLNLSQSSMSGMLARLREHYGDQLLEISGRSMIRTPFAESLIKPLGEAMTCIERLSSSTASFNPATSTRRFSVVTSDYMIEILLPHAMPMIVEQAPQVSIVIELPTGQPGQLLNKGNLDIAIIPDRYVGHVLASEPFCEEDFVVVGWAGNPLMADEMTIEGLQGARHVWTRFPASADFAAEGQPTCAAQYAMRNAGYDLRLTVAVPTLSAVFAAVIGTDLVAVTHRRLANALAHPDRHIVRELPVVVEPLRERLVYHPLRGQDAGLIWLKDIFHTALQRATVSASADGHVLIPNWRNVRLLA